MLNLSPTNRKDKNGKSVYYLESNLNELLGILVLLSPPNVLNHVEDNQIFAVIVNKHCNGFFDKIINYVQSGGQILLEFKRVQDSIRSIPIVSDFSRRIGVQKVRENAYMVNQIIFTIVGKGATTQLIFFFKEHSGSPQNYLLDQDSSLEISS